MSRAPKIKIVAARMLAPKAARVTGSMARRTFPAWIDASERGVAFHATAVMPRVRDSLVLRVVGHKTHANVSRRNLHGIGAR
jgi:hypothetical protein